MTIPEYHLRRARDEDYGFLEGLHIATMRDAVERTWGWDAADQHVRFRRDFDPARSEIIVVEGTDAGVIAVEKSDDGWFVANIQIAPEYQARGVGTRVLRKVMAGAHAADLPVTLQVLKTNRARVLYERLGFSITSSTETHFLMRADSD